jgi:ABC-type transport system involved in cytochrome c biogenesis permease subunit
MTMVLLLIKYMNNGLPVFYIAATIIYGLLFLIDKPVLQRSLRPLLAVSIVVHIFLTILVGVSYKHFPITSIYELLSILALAIAINYFYIEYKIGVKSTGVFVLIVVSLCQVLSSVHRTYNFDISPIIKSVYVGVHSIAATFGYSAFIIAILYGLMYIMLFRNIKSKHFGIIYSRFPSLEQLDEMNYRASSIGFFFMTVSLIFGGIWLSKVITDTSFFDPKIVVAIITWAIFGVNFILKRFFGRGGILTSYLSFFGFMGIIFSMVIVNIFLPTFHLFF